MKPIYVKSNPSAFLPPRSITILKSVQQNIRPLPLPFFSILLFIHSYTVSNWYVNTKTLQSTMKPGFYKTMPLVKLNSFRIFRYFFQVWAPLTESKLLFWTGLLTRDLEWNFHCNLHQMITIPSAQWTGLCPILANLFWDGTRKWVLLKPWLNTLEIQTLPILFCELLMLTMEKWFGITNPLLYKIVIPVM